MPDLLKHIFIRGIAQSSDYISPRGGGGQGNFFPRNRKAHGNLLEKKFKKALEESSQNMQRLDAFGLSSKNGVYVTFQSKSGYDLVTKSLEDMRKKVRLVNVKKISGNNEGSPNDRDEIISATVYIPRKNSNHFLKKIEAYLTEDTQKEVPKNKNLIDSIESIQLAGLESFWQDSKKLMPKEDEEVMCEAWLRVDAPPPKQEYNTLNNEISIASEVSEDSVASAGPDFYSICNTLSIDCLEKETILFPERRVVLIKANKKNLLDLIALSDEIAEFRRVKETAHFFLSQNNMEQTNWANDLKKRQKVNKESKVSICILDTGINNGHILVNPVLSNNDCHTVNETWGADDRDGHGTLMSGLAIYGDLQSALESEGPIIINHKLESVKLINSRQQHPKKLYGYVTKQAISKAEIEKPENKRVICMAVTCEEEEDRKGRPSSWSGALDQITSGSGDDEDGRKRLFIVSAGNVNDEKDWKNYPESNMTKAIHDPAQSWNALAVGAYTNKTHITGEDLKDYEPVAKEGELSPFSTTSLVWETKKWPIKPDIVLEGGNLEKNESGSVTESDDLSLLSLRHKPQENQFSSINATSAATAQAAWIASQIQIQYPETWPETIRALMVHSAEWTKGMKEQFLNSPTPKKKDYQKMLRICGYGVPDLNKALSSYSNSLVLISQEEIQPFARIKETGKAAKYSTKDMHFYKMPWPEEELKRLPDNTNIKLKITLSYFIEPAPGEIGWEHRYRYPSHGLRFALCRPQENEQEFKARVNKLARDEEDNTPSISEDRWLLGTRGRDLGSIHSDIWESNSPPDVAACNLIAVYPTIGWWRERHHLNKCNNKARYSLVVSIATPEEEIDLYTPVFNKVKSLIETPIA